MIATEAEASKRWCPFSRTMLTLNQGETPLMAAAVNRSVDARNEPAFVSCCIGAQCMLWQWSGEEWEYSHEQPNGEGWERNTNVAVLANWRRKRSNRKGFCGMGRAG